MRTWPQSLREETGFGIGTALLYDEWELEVIVPEQPGVLPERKKTSQSVQGEYNLQTGQYTVKKVHTWTF